MQSVLPLRIVKLGGSLLSVNDLRQRFHAWLDSQPPARNLIVVGGGDAVEAIRELDVIHRFPSDLTHWICVDLMSVTARLASALLELGKPLSTEEGLREIMSQSKPKPAHFAVCIQPTAYYTPSIAQQKNCPLPESWECTSDSISAWLASSLSADQLVLLKSTESEFVAPGRLSSEDIRNLADRGIVDPVFPDASKQLSDVRVVNLRLA